MRRLYAATATLVLTRTAASSAGEKGRSLPEDLTMAHPMLYKVPTLSSRTVGRDAEVMALWQNLLLGRHCQVLSGIDGIGKSTIAAEFCDCARRSNRFTCIQWFNGGSALPSQLLHFFLSMKGRLEKDVLLVADDVTDPSAVAAMIPKHDNLYLLLTAGQLTSPLASPEMFVLPTPPLGLQAARDLVSVFDDASGELDDVLALLGYVPILVQIAGKLLDRLVVTPTELLAELQQEGVQVEHQLSISKALRTLLRRCLGALSASYPHCHTQLAMLACCHLSDLSDAVVQAVVGEPEKGTSLATSAAELGVLSIQWQESAFAMHPSVGSILREGISPGDLAAVSENLLSLWPRRWRGTSSQDVYNLVWHTYALSRHFTERNVPFTAAMMSGMDRSAVLLAHLECRDLPIAAQLWRGVYQQHKETNNISAETVRMARECGRVLHVLRDPSARDVLEDAHALCGAVHGQSAAESALILGCLAPYLPANEVTLHTLADGVAVLEARLDSVDSILSRQEIRMLIETMIVLVVCRGKFLQELGMTVPHELWDTLSDLNRRLKGLTPS